MENLPSLLSDVIHNPQHYARDFYFFKRSQYPQLSLTHKKPQEAYNELQAQCFGLKFVEMGKVMLTWGILKNVNQVVQRVVFLHEVRKKITMSALAVFTAAQNDGYVMKRINLCRTSSSCPRSRGRRSRPTWTCTTTVKWER